MQKLSQGTKLHSTTKMGSESSSPSKTSSTENEHSQHKLSRIEIEIHRDGEKNISGHVVTHHHEPTASKSGAFTDLGKPESYVFDGDGHSSTHGHLADHMAEHMPHIFGAEKGMVEAENKTGQGDDEHEEEYV